MSKEVKPTIQGSLINRIKANWIFLLVVIFVIAVVAVFTIKSNSTGLGASEPVMGANFPDAKWVKVDAFSGFYTKKDATKIPDGANANGQNTVVNDGDRISIRNFGSEILGTATTSNYGITSLHTFRKRSGENVLIRTYDTNVEYFEEGNSTWENLIATSTANKPFAFADYNINTDLRSYTYFGNAYDNFMRWNGAHSTTTIAIAAGTTTIHVADTTDFFATGTLRYCSTNLVYTAKTLTTFTVSATAVTCAVNRGVTQAVQESPANPKGNIYLVANNRLFIAGVTSTPQAVYFSKYGDAMTYDTTLVTDSTAENSGIFNLGEGGGAVTGMALDEGLIYIFKKSITYKAELADSFYTLAPLKPFDGKSQTTGAQNSQSIFVGGNGVYFITPDKQIMSLQRVANLDYPQIVPISDLIKETTNEMDFTDAAGISWRSSAFFALKETSDSSENDSVIVYDEKLGVWQSPIVGWSPSEFVVYDDGSGEALYFGDANESNVYKVVDGVRVDNSLALTASWRSKKFDFGEPYTLKEIDEVFVEGYITENTTLNISLLLDEDGYTQRFTTEFLGSEIDFLEFVTPFNILGLQPYGSQRFGTSVLTGKRKFRVYLNKDFRAMPFYNAQIEFGSDTENDDWEILSFGLHVRPFSNPEKRSLYRSFK